MARYFFHDHRVYKMYTAKKASHCSIQNVYCNERLWLKLRARGDSNCAILLAQLLPSSDDGFNPETRMKAVYMCFIYTKFTYSLFIDWLKDS